MNGNGGTLDSEAVTVKYQFNYGSLPTPEKSDRVFEGWYTISNFEDGTKVTDGSIVRNSEDHVLYARYQIPVTFVGTDNQTLMVSYAFEDQPTGITAPSKKTRQGRLHIHVLGGCFRTGIRFHSAGHETCHIETEVLPISLYRK